MFTFAMWVALAAAPVDVVVTDAVARPAVLATLKKELPGDALLDASEVYAALQPPPGLLDFQDFEVFSAAPVPGWPASLASTWSGGLAYCREIAGPPKWTMTTLTGARCCGQRLSLHLWSRYLAAQQAKQVIVVFASADEEKVTVTGTRYAPGQGDELVITREGRSVDVEALARDVTKQLLSGAGVRSRRVEAPVLFEALAKDPWPESVAVGPVQNLKTCPRLPAALVVETPGAVAPMVTQRWVASVKGEGPPLTCALRFSRHHELPSPTPLGPTELQVVTTVLDCGQVTVVAELAGGPLAKTQSDAVAARLITALTARLCR
jgi:hypothetical protein